MRESDFKNWLSDNYKTTDGHSFATTTLNARLSNCRKVEQYEGDLDQHFATDNLTGLLNRLAYSRDDERHNAPVTHSVPISGNLYNGTATLRSAINLYLQFCIAWPAGTVQPDFTRTDQRRSIKKGRSSWPEWSKPTEAEILDLAKLTTRYFRFLHPDIVQAIVADNEANKNEWVEGLEKHGLTSEAYLWEGSPCAFPGIRRYAGSKEIAEYRGHGSREGSTYDEALQLDDNDFPKQAWSFIFTGRKFSKKGPKGFALAHLADHKLHKNRFREDFVVKNLPSTPPLLFGLYTSVANAAYVPANIIKPTDFAGPFRNLLMRRAQSLYGKFCQLLPPFLGIPDCVNPSWDLDSFEWCEPVGTLSHLDLFLEFRRQVMSELISREPAH